LNKKVRSIFNSNNGVLARIVDGQPVGSGAIPHQAALRYSSQPDKVLCGGTILSTRFILTAAHCTNNNEFTMRSREIIVTVGHLKNNYTAARSENGFQESRVDAIIEHKDWNSREVLADIAMLKLSKSLSFSQTVYPACLPPVNFRSDREVFTTSTRQKEGTICIISGWGETTGKGDNYPDRLQSATIPIMKRSQCNQLLKERGWGEGALPDDRELCAGYLSGGINICQGDSGGPLTCNVDGHWTVTGVMSWTPGDTSCADPKSPGVYTRVTKFNQWINQVQSECINQSSQSCKELTYLQDPR